MCGREVDFVVKEGKKISQLIQVCFGISHFSTKEREVAALIAGSTELRCKKLLVVTYDYSAEEKIKGRVIKYVPLWRWLLD